MCLAGLGLVLSLNRHTGGSWKAGVPRQEPFSLSSVRRRAQQCPHLPTALQAQLEAVLV